MLAFPVTMGFAELATYFGYIMPRLRQRVKPGWLALFLPIFFLSIQHCTMPLIFQEKFIVLRGLMYLPFAAMLGTALNKRPTLLPYLAVLHGLLDAMTVMMVSRPYLTPHVCYL
jgi:membrane protease YdiL (CAAX protease family)